MEYKVVRVSEENYSSFSDMIHWRITENQRLSTTDEINDNIKKELSNCNFYVFAVEIKNIFVGWISIIYLPKVGKYNGQGHVYIDELWIEPSHRSKGLAKALMEKAEDVSKELNATGIRLYVNEENPNAKNLYEKCGFIESGKAYFMEKKH